MIRHLKKTSQRLLRSVSKTLLRQHKFFQFFRVQISAYPWDRVFGSQFPGLILFYLQKCKLQDVYESQWKAYFRDYRVLGKVSYKIQSYQGPLDSSQCFQDPLDTLPLQDKLVPYFHSKCSTLCLTLIPSHWNCRLLVPVFWIFIGR